MEVMPRRDSSSILREMALPTTPLLVPRLGSILLLFAAIDSTFALFRVFDWYAGAIRGLMLAALLGGLLLLGRIPPMPGEHRSRPRWITMLILAALALNLTFAIYTVARTARSGIIPLDQGQSSSTAAQLLRQGINPYGVGTLADISTFMSRVPSLTAKGVGPHWPDSTPLYLAAERYALHPDLATARLLLPAPNPTLAEATRGERALFGYKYGPVPMLGAAMLLPLAGPAAVMVLNAAACFALFAVLAVLLHRLTLDRAIVGLAFLMILCERNISWNYLNLSATDVWPLLFGALAVLATLNRRPILLGLTLGLALGSKLFPSLLFLPLLLMPFRPKAIAIFALSLAALYLPWIVWDARGLFYNLLLWPFLMKDNTSWLYYLGDRATLPIRTALVVVIGWAWWRQLAEGDPARLPLTLALVATATCAAGGVFHNDYVPWFSIWLPLALAVQFGGVRESLDLGPAPRLQKSTSSNPIFSRIKYNGLNLLSS
jgi:hypothetical protein